PPTHRTNNCRNSSQGGFRPNLPSSDANSSERLTDYPGQQYDYAIVINFNRQPYSDQRAYRGAGIFLHVNGSGATAGCVSLTRTNLLTVFSYLRPGDRITIVR
ncbi:MAG: L,D-transpeptidase family protein, partial [Propionibacteriaceae bacterium]